VISVNCVMLERIDNYEIRIATFLNLRKSKFRNFSPGILNVQTIYRHAIFLLYIISIYVFVFFYFVV
jgi:hypothetical protein